jgi:hypothetical protein
MESTSVDAQKKIIIHGHISATPEKFADLFSGKVSSTIDEDCDVALFVVNPSAGIDQPTVELWRSYDELLTPRAVLVTVLDGLELDFDDAVLLANRLFDQLVTPFLVLHGESGTPIGTISLTDLKTFDYSTNPPTIGDADQELREMVEDFREEYLEQIAEMGEGGFASGILFPAIPINTVNGLGVDIAHAFIAELPSRS